MNKKIKVMISFITAFSLVLSCFVFSSAEESSNDTVAIMPLGDSITDGFTSEGLGAYREKLYNLLIQNGHENKFDFVGPNWGGNFADPQHAGFSGYSIDNIPQDKSISGQRTGLYSFIDWLMETYPADIVMLQIGTNDILSLYDLDNAGTRLELLIDKIMSYLPDDGMLFLATIPCMDATNTLYINQYYFTVDSMDECVNTYNNTIKEIVRKRQANGENIRLADINSVLTKDDLYDGVHPKKTGYDKMGEYWFNTLDSYWKGSQEETTEPTLIPTEPVTEPSSEPTQPATEITDVTETTAETTPATETTTEVTDITEITTETDVTVTTVTSETIAITEITQPVTETTGTIAVIPGDINNDENISLTDLTILNKYLIKKYEMNTDEYIRADISQDGYINIFDSILIRRTVLGI